MLNKYETFYNYITLELQAKFSLITDFAASTTAISDAMNFI